MFTPMILATAVIASLLAVVVLVIVTGWFPRLAALTARGLESLLRLGTTPHLDMRDRAELAARLWVP